MGLFVHEPCDAVRSDPSRADPEMDGSEVFDGAAVAWPCDAAATANADTAAAHAKTINRLMRIVPFPLFMVEIKARIPAGRGIYVFARCKFCHMDNRRHGGTVRLDLDELRRLARDLAARRDSAYAEVRAEVETMKAALRERATAIAERERRLAELEERVGAKGLAGELAAARRAAAEAEAERALAAAERERLDEREQQIRRVEKELAARRVELEQRERVPVRRPPVSARQRELDAREAALDEREAALELREAALRGDTMSMPALGFADGLTALTHPDAG